MKRRSSLVLLGLLLACPAREPSPAEPTPAAQRSAEPAEAGPERVTIELGLVPDDARRALAERHGEAAAIVAAPALLAVRHSIAEPWHIYWKNPGESGLRTRLKLAGAGFTAGEPLYPAPERFVALGGQVSYGWAREVVLFVPLTELRDDARIELRSDWLACHESCVPGHAERSVALGQLAPADDALIRAMLARVPEPAGDRLRPRWTGAALHVEPGRADIELRELFPYANAQAPLESTLLRDNALDLNYRFDAQPPAELGQGVLAVTEAGEPRWLELAVPWPPT